MNLKSRPASKGQYGYGFVLNSSRNQVVCHGVPSADEVLMERRHRQSGHHPGEGRLHRRFQQDLSDRQSVGPQAARRLVRTTYEAMWKGIRTVRPGARLGDIGFGHRTPRQTGGLFASCATTAATASGARCTKTRRCCISARRGRAWPCVRAWSFTIEPMLNQGKSARSTDRGRRLDRGHVRRKTVGPVRAYGGGDKGRRARAYPAPGRDAGALGEIVLRFALRLASPRLGEGDSVPSSFAPI